MQRPEEVNLSREDGAALIERLEDNTLTTDDRRVLVKLITFHVWLLLALQEAKLSLKRLRSLLFGEQPKKRAARSPDKAPDSRDGDEDTGAARIVGDNQQHLENLRRKGLLPRLRNARLICLLGRLFRLKLRGFC